MPGPTLKEPSATVARKEQEEQRATASTASTPSSKRRANRSESGRPKATGRAHGRGDAGRDGSGKGGR